MENWTGLVKTVLGLALLAGFIFFGNKLLYGKYEYEGADEPGYSYPDTVREEVMDNCTSSFRKFLNATDSDVENLCACYLDSLEDNYSFKEFDKRFRDRLMQYQGQDNERLLHKCAQRNGLRIN
jgi:hypothetical protein